MMKFLRANWFDLGLALSLVVEGYILYNNSHLTRLNLLLWVSLVALFFHQAEEYRIAGTFPGMVNRVMYNSDKPDRYPLNPNTAFYVNVVMGWTFYFLAAILAQKALWLGIATMLVSAGNIIAHTLLFNIKGKTWYNAGLATCWILFAPCVALFFYVIHTEHLVKPADYWIGVPLGIALNLVGIVKMIDWMADANTPYVFEQRNLLPQDRKKKNK